MGHKSLAIRRNSNSSQLEGDICVDANFSGPKDEALAKMRKSRHKQMQTLCLRQHSNSSNLGEDIKLKGEEQEAQEELNKPESPRDEPPWQKAVTEEQDAAVNVQGETIKSATPGDSVPMMKKRKNKKSVKPTSGERTPAESPGDEPPSQGARTEEQVAAVNVQGETIKSATHGDNVPMMKNKKSVKPTFGERTPAESPGDEPPSQGARTEEQDTAVNVQGETIKSATPSDNAPMKKKKNKKSVKPTRVER